MGRFTTRKEFESAGNASFGAVYVTSGQVVTMNFWAYIPMEASEFASVTAEVYNSSGALTTLAGVTVPLGVQVPLPNGTSFELTSGRGFLLRTEKDT